MGRVFVCLLAVLLSACAGQTRLRPDDVRPLHYVGGGMSSDRSIDGLRDALQRSPDRPVRVLTVHGMVVSRDNYSRALQDAIGERLGLVRLETRDRIELERGYEVMLQAGPQPVMEPPATARSRVTRQVWVDRPVEPNSTNAAGSPPRLIFYELFWAPLRDEVKYSLLGCFESRSVDRDRERADDEVWDCSATESSRRNSDRRSVVNGMLKDEIMVRGFADALVVAGPVGQVLQDDLSLATCVVAAEALADIGFIGRIEPETFSHRRCDAPDLMGSDQVRLEAFDRLREESFFVVTESLGSYFLLAAEMERGESGMSNAIDVLQFGLFDDATIYMLANQVALLNLAAVRAVCLPDEGLSASCPNRRLPSLDQVAAGGIGTFGPIVAFNDVDDLLGFELPPYLMQTGATGQMVNVSVHNPAPGIPFLFRSFSRVHTNQSANAAIIDAIVDGIEIPAEQQAR